MREHGEREGKLSGESFPFLSPTPSPSSSKTFNWWGGRTKGVRSDASPKEQVPAGRLEQRFSPCPLIPPQAGPRWRGLGKARIAGLSWDVWGNMFHSREYAALGNAVNKDSINTKIFEGGGRRNVWMFPLLQKVPHPLANPFPVSQSSFALKQTLRTARNAARSVYLFG